MTTHSCDIMLELTTGVIATAAVAAKSSLPIVLLFFFILNTCAFSFIHVGISGRSSEKRVLEAQTELASSSEQFFDGTVTVSRKWSMQGNRGNSFRTSNGSKSVDPPNLPNEEVESTFLNLSYRIYHPQTLQKKRHHDIDGRDGNCIMKAPIVVLHGGPSLPSEYLYSISQEIPPSRAIIFYDQIGCGRSSEPSNIDFYGISHAIDDLKVLLCDLEIDYFHLLGHSFGGVLAYEYANRAFHNSVMTAPKCLSVILANTPTDMQKSNYEWERLQGNTPNDRFFFKHQCRLKNVPDDLVSAFDHCGSIWVGTGVVAEWKACSPSDSLTCENGNESGNNLCLGMPPFALIRGEHDFVTHSCTSEWKSILGDALVEEVVMENCSHYVHFENPNEFSSIIESFVSRYDCSAS